MTGAARSLPSRGAWIEIFLKKIAARHYTPSLPSRGAWIEIIYARMSAVFSAVAPLAGSVDRNPSLEEGQENLLRSLPSRGAWIEISGSTLWEMLLRSLPSRGAWIEI